MSLRARDAEISAKLEKAELRNRQLEAILRVHHVQLPSDSDYLDQNNSLLSDVPLPPANGITSSRPDLRVAHPVMEELIDLNDPQNAIDVILYLEQNCLDHIHQHRGEDNEKGHSLQLQMSIMESTTQATQPWSKSRVSTWSSLSTSKPQLEAQLERLLSTARVLDLQGELTPVMCWYNMKETVAKTPLSVKQLDQLLTALLPNMSCRG